MLHLPTPYLICDIISGLCWTLAYILIIRRGHIDHAHGMPLWALALNFAWEFNYSFITPTPMPQRAINIIWCLFDCVILIHFFKYCKIDYPTLKSKYMYPLTVLAFVVCWTIVVMFQVEFAPFAPADYPLGMGRAYSAWGMDVSMAIIFVYFIIRRNNVLGQSLYIALAMFIGNVFAAIPFIVYQNAGVPGVPKLGFFYPFAFTCAFLFNIIYICQVWTYTKNEGLNPLRRV
ncbi:MAG: hypothetical protein E7A62_07885 [Actinomycetaceae bacterium]|nr:hypothetical protein [Actinomycetaceae bacterium]MDU0970897.1 hypothetical protein [Actinomycetaceae bacterium]